MENKLEKIKDLVKEAENKSNELILSYFITYFKDDFLPKMYEILEDENETIYISEKWNNI